MQRVMAEISNLPPTPSPQWLNWLERLTEFRVFLLLLLAIVALDVALATFYQLPLATVQWPEPLPVITFGAACLGVVLFMIYIAVLVPLVHPWIGYTLFLSQPLWRWLIPRSQSEQHPPVRSWGEVTCRELRDYAMRERCEFTWRLVEAQEHEERASQHENVQTAKLAFACNALLLIELVLPNSTARQLDSDWAVWLTVGLVCVMAWIWMSHEFLERSARYMNFPPLADRLDVEEKAKRAQERPLHRPGLR